MNVLYVRVYVVLYDYVAVIIYEKTDLNYSIH